MTGPALFRGALFSERLIHLALLDTRRRIAALIEILLFGAIPHHAGMGNISLLFGIRRNRGFIRHIEYSARGGGVFADRRVDSFYLPPKWPGL